MTDKSMNASDGQEAIFIPDDNLALTPCRQCQTSEYIKVHHNKIECGEPDHLDESFSISCSKCGSGPDSPYGSEKLAKVGWDYFQEILKSEQQ